MGTLGDFLVECRKLSTNRSFLSFDYSTDDHNLWTSSPIFRIFIWNWTGMSLVLRLELNQNKIIGFFPVSGQKLWKKHWKTRTFVFEARNWLENVFVSLWCVQMNCVVWQELHFTQDNKWKYWTVRELWAEK